MMLEARLNTHALAGAMAENIRQGFYGEADELEAANPYGCNQYGEGWKMPHNGKQAAKGKYGKVTLDASYVEPYSDKSYIVRKTRNGKGIFVPAKLCKFDGEKCVISVPPGSDLSDKLKKFEDETEDTHKEVDLDDKVRNAIWKHIGDRDEAGEEFDGDEEFDRIYDAHREEREEKYWEARLKALDSGASDAEASSRARKARQKADEDFLRDFAENLQAASADDGEEVEAFNQWGCNGSGHKLGCRKAKGSRESKEKNQPRLFRVDPDADPYKQKVQLAQAIEEAAQDGVHLEAVIKREGIGELTLDCGKPGRTEAKRNREQAEENERAKKEGREPKKISSGGNGALHAVEGRHNIDAFDIAEAIIDGKITQAPNHKSRLNLSTDKCKVTVEREMNQNSGRISKNKFKLHTAQKN